MDIWSRKSLEATQEIQLSRFNKNIKYFTPGSKGLIGFKTKKEAQFYIDSLNKKVILYYDNMKQRWSLDYAQGYIQKRIIGKEYIDGGFNIFGEKLPDRIVDIVAESLKYKLGDSICDFKTLDDAHNFIKKYNFIQVLNIH